MARGQGKKRAWRGGADSAEKARTRQARDTDCRCTVLTVSTVQSVLYRREGSVITLASPALVTLRVQSQAAMSCPISHGPPILVSMQGGVR